MNTPPGSGRGAGPAVAVFVRDVRLGHNREYEALVRRMVEASERFPGQLAATMLHEPASSTYTVVYSFVDRRALGVWLDSPERRRLVAQADAVSRAHHRLPSLTGLETWFALPHRPTVKPPPRWKMWLVSLLAIYPLVVAFQAALVPKIKGWPLLARSAVLPLTLLTLMTFVVMPVATLLVQPWLSPPRD